MYKLILLILLFVTVQDKYSSISPDGKFKLVITATEESDSNGRYRGKLMDVASKRTIDLFDCLKHDEGRPNFYWSKDSRYLLFEKGNHTQGPVVLFNLLEQKTEAEFRGFIGMMPDERGQQYDAVHNILLYFCPRDGAEFGDTPDLYVLDLNTKKSRKICSFESKMDMELPQIKRAAGKREVELSYVDDISGKRIQRRVQY